jgi:hypothetical protein
MKDRPILLYKKCQGSGDSGSPKSESHLKVLCDNNGKNGLAKQKALEFGKSFRRKNQLAMRFVISWYELFNFINEKTFAMLNPRF